MQTLTIPTPDDLHIHLRDGAALARTVPDAAAQCARAHHAQPHPGGG